MGELTNILRQKRIEQDLNQTELGRKLGLPQSHISKIEKGLTDPRLSTVSDIARLLEQEVIIVPRDMLPMIQALLNNEDAEKPMWSLEDKT